ncbi:hypothetical protein BJF79_28250 [Actinomadura sp. CNU-125]|uniref:hypothetical protein n=1 Tax=Actinomadura sp. CNU-125 TaxID=1904961 RepID=UPI000967B8EB|nr:hypothetical protein [Actinomadura sp. CNU-125]OLT37988.1 hypothetical protein BJF79_28250 [Actinomadura sp. CNU-125]
MPVKLLGLGTVEGRVRALAALALLALVVLVVSAGFAVRDGREGARTLGEREGPLAENIGDMYFALAEMDAQVTRVLLTGGEAGWLCAPEVDGSGCERSGARYMYDIRREDAQQAALSATRLAGGEGARLRTVRSVLNTLHTYDRHVQAAMTAAADSGQGTDGTAAALPEAAVREYRTATALMTRELLPEASNLVADSAADVATAYREEHSAVRAGRLRVLAAGLALLAAVGSLQVYLARRFRRLLSAPLAAALAGALALTVTAAARLDTEADRLEAAKTAGLDPVLALTRVQALSTGMDTDRARQIVDPDNAGRYDNRYLDKSQTLLHLAGATGLDAYYRELGRSVAGWDGNPRAVDFGGYYGRRARGEVARAGDFGALLTAYGRYQDHNRDVRELADGGRLDAAARAHMDPRWGNLPHPTFRSYDRELDARVSHHQYRRVHAALRAEQALRPMPWLLPAAALAIAALVVAGVWPRLAEYR